LVLILKNQIQKPPKNSNKFFAKYVTTKIIDGFTIPPPLQVLLIKEYCKNKDILFSLPVEEFRFEGFYIELFGILKNIKKLDGLIMPSIKLIPKEKKYMDDFFQICNNENLEIHFILESIIIKSTYNEIEGIKDILIIDEISKKYSNRISEDLKGIIN